MLSSILAKSFFPIVIFGTYRRNRDPSGHRLLTTTLALPLRSRPFPLTMDCSFLSRNSAITIPRGEAADEVIEIIQKVNAARAKATRMNQAFIGELAQGLFVEA